MAEASHAVFLSYASQDAEAAQRICDALRAAGIEVWFDRSELRGGDAWDQKIRHEIHDCALFVPVISQQTQERLEGYFRREWKLAVERTHDMAEQMPFLVPVVIDGTGDREAFVPDTFRAVQWTRLAGGETPPAFVERVKRLLSPDLSPMSAVSAPASGIGERIPASRRSQPLLLVIAATIVFAALGYLFADRFWISKHLPPSAPAFAPPAHSIAVLPFMNMSGDKEQEYLSDGFTEELLNSLAEINELQVAARTSAFSFKGKDTDIATVAHKLNVGSVLEGSVRRSGNTVRITAQLINAVTGFHLWSHTYDRDLGDVLKLETEIAGAVASALKVSLLGDSATKIELGGTRNPAAFDAHLRGLQAMHAKHEAKDMVGAITTYDEAIALDPSYALAFANRSLIRTAYTSEAASGAEIRQGFEKAEADARQAIALAPNLAEAHIALAYVLEQGTLDFAQVAQQYERAMALAPGAANVLRFSGAFAALMGNFSTGIAALQHAIALDPLYHASHFVLGRALYAARRYAEAAAAFADAISLNPDFKSGYGERGLALYALGEFEHARLSCETNRDDWVSQWCLAMVYYKLGRLPEAEAERKKYEDVMSESGAYQFATIYAQWGNHPKALAWLEKALHLRDSGLENLKTDPLMDPLREEPRFQAVMQELNFPNSTEATVTKRKSTPPSYTAGRGPTAEVSRTGAIDPGTAG